MRDDETAAGDDLAAAREMLRRLLDEADQAASQVVARADDARRDHANTLAREIGEVESVRRAMLERLDAANERFDAAERVVATSQARLAEIDVLHDEANRSLASAAEHAAAMIAGVEAEVDAVQAKARSDADLIVHDAESEARRILDDAVAYRLDVERRAADTLGQAEVKVEQAIREATEQRHADIVDLQTREREITDRIHALLAEGVAVERLGVVPGRRGPDRSTHTIDLTDGVGSAIRSVIDEWSSRRTRG